MSQISSENAIVITLENHIKTIALNRASSKNSLIPASFLMIQEAIQQSYEDGTKVIILTGEGENFCSGLDLTFNASELAQLDVANYVRIHINALILAIKNINIPIIAKIKGACVGLGLNLALACDMIFTTPDTRMSELFTKIGLSSDGGGSYFLLQKLGYAKAFELLTLASFITPEDAEKWGLINKVIMPNDLDDYVQNIATKLANGPFVAIKNMKANLRAASNGNLEATLEAEAIHQANSFHTKDFMEGVMAFLQKREANFKGV